ncbi:MAG: AMP-binding protein [Bacteroidales bacterium]|nr:AMP-binding protein [Bacteroidales bacterium]
MIKIPEIEQQSKHEIRVFQQKKLQELLQYVSQNSPFYQRVFEENNIDIQSIKTLEDLVKIPVTTKEHLSKYNDEFLCVPKQKIIDYITTSGTLGDPVTFAMTDADLDRLAYNECISFATAGINENDTLQLMTTIDRRFMAGLAYFLGARKLGAGIVRVGNGIPELQWDTIQRIKPTAIIAVPSFILKIIEYAEQNGIDYKNSSIKKAICIGEALRNADFTLSTLAEKIKSKWNIELYSTYASTEMGTAFPECEAGRGGHHHPELIIVEFLDENDQPVNTNEPGEITVTTLGVEGMPLIRFKTGDLAYHYSETCSCGRTTMRLGPVIGRQQQMIKYKGTTLYPPSLYNILADFSAVKDYYVEAFTNQIGTDEIKIYILSFNQTEEFEKQIKDHFRAKLRVAPLIEFINEEQLKRVKYPENSRKPISFFDLRKHN